MFPERLAGQPQALVTLFDESTIAPSLALAQELRAAGLRVDVYPDPGRYGKQFRYADERGIRHALLVGPRELEAGIVAVKDLETGDQTDIPRSELADALREVVV